MAKPAPNKRLLFIAHTDNLRGGAERELLGLIYATKKHGFYVHVIVPSKDEFYVAAKKAGAECSVVRSYWWGRPESSAESIVNFKAVASIRKIIEKEKIDCVITNTLVTPWGALAAALSDRPHIWIASQYFVGKFSNLADHYDFIKTFSNGVIADSKNYAIYIRNVVGIKNATNFYPYIDVSDIKLKPANSNPRLINIGNIFPNKNQLELLQAVVKLRGLGIEPQVLFFGQYDTADEYYKKLQAFIKKNHLDRQVTFMGFKQKPFNFVTKNDIYVQNSKSETLGAALIQCMKLGLVCVSSNIPATKEVFNHGGGNTYSLGDANDLAKKLKDILENNSKHKDHAHRYQKSALKNLSEKKGYENFFKLINTVLRKPNNQRQLRHLSVFLDGLVDELAVMDEKIETFRDLIIEKRNALQNIADSRNRETVLAARKLLRRHDTRSIE